MRLLIVRHGTTDTLEQSVFQSPDTPLNAQGVRQAQALGERLRRETIHAAYVSDYERTRATAAEILRHHPGMPTVYCAALRERHSGIFRGRPAEEFAASHAASGLPIHAFRPDGGESWEDAQRCVAAFYAETILPRHADDTVLLVSHGTVLRCLLLALAGRDFSDPHAFHFDNCGITVIRRHTDGRHEVLAENDTTHLVLRDAVAVQGPSA